MTTKTIRSKDAAQARKAAPAPAPTTGSAGKKPKPPAPESAASARLRKEARAAVAANLAQIEGGPGGDNGTGAQAHNEQGGQQPAQPAPDERKQDVPKPARKGGKSDKKSGPGAKPAKTPKPKRLSCIDAAAQIIGGDPVSCADLIAEMGVRKLWTSPNGKTPDASLYAAITREIAAKGADARFKKVDRGLFIAGPGATKRS